LFGPGWRDAVVVDEFTGLETPRSPVKPRIPATRVATVLTATAVLVAASILTGPSAAVASARPAHAASVRPIPAVTGHIQAAELVSPLPTSTCVAQIGIHCYSPLQYRTAYDLNPLYAKGVTGQGRTIVIVDSFGSPTIQNDLQAFDAQWGLPDTTVQIVQAGTIPPFDPTDGTMVGWAQETTLDVEYAHAIAPGAHIVLVETPVAETEGVTGFPEMMNAEKSLIDQGVGDVISQSFGATENTFPGFDRRDFSSLLNLRFAFQDAARHAVTVLGASGDAGATDLESDTVTTFPFAVNSWPSSDPLVTSIGGTQLTLDDSGNRVQPDVVWNDGFGAGGGGISHVFGRPLFQTGVRSVVGDHRGTPDISMSAAVDGACWVYYSFIRPTSPWHLFGGTSEATPIFSGIVALADQMAGHRIGDINGALYLLGAASQLRHPLRTGLVDVTSGDNSFAGVTGFPAGPGYDLSSGWGTIDAATFVPTLARL
jgi:subtilase family serine protease